MLHSACRGKRGRGIDEKAWLGEARKGTKGRERAHSRCGNQAYLASGRSGEELSRLLQEQLIDSTTSPRSPQNAVAEDGH